MASAPLSHRFTPRRLSGAEIGFSFERKSITWLREPQPPVYTTPRRLSGVEIGLSFERKSITWLRLRSATGEHPLKNKNPPMRTKEDSFKYIKLL